MKNYRDLAQQVQTIYEDSGDAFSSFQRESRLSCPSGCGKCCLGTNITASQLEMLPLALKLIDEDKAEPLFEELINDPPLCVFYQKDSPDGSLGHCNAYSNRPSLCRSFGASARLNKFGKKEWVICKLIKNQEENHLFQIDINNSPIIGTFATKIITLDPFLGNKLYPINEALKLILEKLLVIKSYQTLK